MESDKFAVGSHSRVEPKAETRVTEDIRAKREIQTVFNLYLLT